MNRNEYPPTALHVYLDEPGGGPGHVGLLKDILGNAVRWEAVRLDPRRLGPSPLGWVDTSRQVGRLIGSKPVIVHAHGVRAAAAAFLAARRHRVPLVITVHGLHSLRRSRGAATLAALALNWIVLRSADRVLVLSEGDRRVILQNRLASAGRVQRISAAYAPRPRMHRLAAREALGLPEDADVILWLGRLAPQKDPLTFLRALESLRGNDRIGLLVGDGPLLPAVRTRAEGADLAGRVRLTGWMDDPAPPLAASDVFVSTSKWEGLPMAALEAAAAGLPLVLTDCPGNRDVIAAGIPAVLAPPGDAMALSREIARLLEDPDLRLRLGRESRAAVARLTPQRLGAEMLKVYQEIWHGAFSQSLWRRNARVGRFT